MLDKGEWCIRSRADYTKPIDRQLARFTQTFRIY
jgi:hypothetical protein